ncbi:MAG TPA: Spy/CpxP family protein refolding chaperone, partial [Longimicrobiales bacterium]|nr:Spy/CpxP family protein refolding chaperone [Longimicrobiales bacterium]
LEAGMKNGSGAVMLLLLAVGVSVADAQETRPAQPWGVGVGVGSGVEQVLRLREELKLTAAQVQQLEEIRKEQVQAQQEIIELQSRLATGQPDEAEQTRLRDRLQQLRTSARDSREGIDRILTEEQREQLRSRRLRGVRAGPGLSALPWGFQPDWRFGFGPLVPGYRGFGVVPPMRNYWFDPSWRGQMQMLPRWRWRGEW